VTRDPVLQRFIDSLQFSISCRLNAYAEAADTEIARSTADVIFERLAKSSHTPSTSPVKLPACQFFAPALNAVTSSFPDVVEPAEVLGVLEPQFVWYRRAGAEAIGEPFFNGHANAMIVGRGGIEERTDVALGCTVISPHIQYPDHRHLPAEVYLVLSKGDWRQEKKPWHEPGIGGIVYNSPNIVHAMRAHEEPLLAIWCLLSNS